MSHSYKARMLTIAQRRVINNDDVAWIGWDARDRPVVGAWYYAGRLQPVGDIPDQPGQRRRNKDSEWREWALTKAGNPVDVTIPVVRMFDRLSER